MALLASLLFLACSGGRGSGGRQAQEAASDPSGVTPAPLAAVSPKPGLTGFPSPSTAPASTASPILEPTFAKNIILFIGDGMGIESAKAASMFATGQESGLNFQKFPHQALMTDDAAGGVVTDSAASATAIATGVKVSNGVTSVRLPGDGSHLATLLELYKSRGKSVGMVTTSYLEDATPAAFAAHQSSRNRRDGIAADYLQRSRPQVLMGGYTPGALDPAAASAGGYLVITDRAAMTALGPLGSQPVAGLFKAGSMPFELDGDYSTIPDLSEMTKKALRLLETDPQGFFVLIENENIDESAHANEIERHLAATVELSEAVQEALDWADTRGDTLILVAADHETGGLTVQQSLGKGKVPQVTWSTSQHTSTLVRVYAKGPRAEGVEAMIDNTDLVRLLTGRPTITL